MIQYPVTVAGHEIPPGTECYCVTRHIPAYAHVMPYVLPDGRILYLCPNTYHATNTLMAMYRKLDGCPSFEDLTRFAIVPQRLAKMHWRMEQESVTSEQILSAAKLTRLIKAEKEALR